MSVDETQLNKVLNKNLLKKKTFKRYAAYCQFHKTSILLSCQMIAKA